MNENKELEELIDCIGKWILQDEEKPGLLDPIRLAELQFANAVLVRLAEGSDMKVTYDLHKPFKEIGNICIEGESLEFLDCKWLARAIEFASNVEVYPLTNGRVRLVLTFHGLTDEIK